MTILGTDQADADPVRGSARPAALDAAETSAPDTARGLAASSVAAGKPGMDQGARGDVGCRQRRMEGDERRLAEEGECCQGDPRDEVIDGARSPGTGGSRGGHRWRQG